MGEQVLQDGRVVLRNVLTGQLGSVPLDQAAKFANDPDFKVVDAAEYSEAKALAEAQTLGGQAQTFVRGAGEAVGDIAGVLGRPLARAAIKGASAISGAFGGNEVDPNQLEESLYRSIPSQIAGAVSGGTTDERIAASNEYADQTNLLKQANPGVYGAGELTGNLGVGLLTGGLTSAAGKGIAGALGRAGLGEIASSALGTGAAMATEGTLYGAAQTEAAARDAGQTTGATSEQLFQGIGLSALIGGGLGVGMGAAGSAFRKLMSKADPGSVTKTATEAAETVISNSDGALTTDDFRLWQGRTKAIEEAVPRMTENLERLDTAIDEVSERVRKMPMKRTGVEGMLENVNQRQASRVGLGKLSAFANDANEILDAIPKDDPAMGPMQKRLGRFVHYVNNKIDEVKSGTRDAADVYIASDEIKREAQAVQDSLKNTIKRHSEGSVTEAARKTWQSMENDLQEPFRQSLEDTSIWGRAGEAQREVNKRWRPFIDENNDYHKAINNPIAKEEWAGERQKFTPESSKVQSFIEGIGTTRGQSTQDAVRERIRAAQDLIDTIAEYHPLTELQQSHLDTARAAYKSIQTDLAQLDKTMARANLVEELATQERQGGVPAAFQGMVGAAVKPMLGAAAGFATGQGAMGRLEQTGLGAIGLLDKPFSILSAKNQLRTLAERSGIKTVSAAGNWVKDSAKSIGRTALAATEPVAKAASRVATPTAITLFMGRDKDLQSAYERRTNQLIQAQQNPNALIDNLAKVSGGLETIDPELAGALIQKAQNAIAFLASKAPAGTLDPTALMPGRKAVVPAVEMARYARVWAAVEKPMTVLDDLRKGIATPDQVDALKYVHPETYQAIRSSVMDALVDVAHKGGRIPIATRQQLDLLLDLGGAGEPAFAAAISDRIINLQASQKKLQPKQSHKAPNLVASARMPQDNWTSA